MRRVSDQLIDQNGTDYSIHKTIFMDRTSVLPVFIYSYPKFCCKTTNEFSNKIFTLLLPAQITFLMSPIENSATVRFGNQVCYEITHI